MYIKYNNSESFSALAARLAAEGGEERGVPARIRFEDAGTLEAVIADDNKEEVINAIANLMYNQDISVEEVTAALTAKSLIGEPKKKGKYILLPMDLEDK